MVTSVLNIIDIGLGYTSKIDIKSRSRWSSWYFTRTKKRYNEVMVRLLNTVGIKINGDQLPFRTSSTPMGIKYIIKQR